MADGPAIETALPSKITPPEPGWIFEREALSGRLVELSASVRRIWVSAPGGAGKTTLVRALLASDARPLVWYQVDAQDQDPANLFFYLSRTVPDVGKAQNLPPLTPEHLPHLGLFCRNFFRAYFPLFPGGCVLVFDDVQEASGEGVLAMALAAAMAELPQNSAIYVLSREEPFASLARDRMNRSLAHVSWEELRLSPEETRGFLAWSLEREPSPSEVERAFALTHGWLAGLLLFLENPGVEPSQPFERMELLFDYFAGETFARLPIETQGLLLTCSVMPVVDAEMAGRLAGCADASAFLRALARGNHFTFRISAERDVYRFHPLFRQFLQARAAQQLGARRLAANRIDAARLFLAAGEAENAAELLIAAEAWEELVALVAVQAPLLLRQGRSRTLLSWLKALPMEARQGSAWLRYWYGCCVNAENPAEAREELTHAFEMFEAAGDPTGAVLSWGMAVYAIVVGWNDMAELDGWIVRFHRLREHWPGPPPPEIEALMVQSICQALAWREPSSSELAGWIAKLQKMVAGSTDASFRTLAGADLVLYHILVGDIASGLAFVELLHADVHQQGVSTAQKMIWLATKGFAECMALKPARCIATMESAKALVDVTGVQFALFRTAAPAVIMALTTGEVSTAKRFLGELTTSAVAMVDQGFLALLRAELADLEGDARRAATLAEIAIEKSTAAGTPIGVSLALGVAAVVSHHAGCPEQALEMADRGLVVGRGMNYFECLFQWLSAHFALEAGQTEVGLELLRRSFRIAARQGYRNFLPWRPRIMARLCRDAIGAGIEADYARRLAAARGLDIAPCGPALTPKELEILSWVVAGKTSGEIATIQGISERTVKFHVSNILQKLGATTRAHAVSIALDRGLVSGGVVRSTGASP